MTMLVQEADSITSTRHHEIFWLGEKCILRRSCWKRRRVVVSLGDVPLIALPRALSFPSCSGRDLGAVQPGQAGKLLYPWQDASNEKS